jgi:transposase-like protein
MTANQAIAVRSNNGVAPQLPSPDPEVVERAHRRQFTASYKLRILEEADACKPGAVGALLRREALYSSHLTAWRRQRDQGMLSAFQSRRGRPSKDPAVAELARLRMENERLTHKLVVAETIIEVQKKVSALLGITLGSSEQGGRL